LTSGGVMNENSTSGLKPSPWVHAVESLLDGSSNELQGGPA
jgi:hypothetical protein